MKNFKTNKLEITFHVSVDGVLFIVSFGKWLEKGREDWVNIKVNGENHESVSNYLKKEFQKTDHFKNLKKNFNHLISDLQK